MGQSNILDEVWPDEAFEPNSEVQLNASPLQGEWFAGHTQV